MPTCGKRSIALQALARRNKTAKWLVFFRFPSAGESLNAFLILDATHDIAACRANRCVGVVIRRGITIVNEFGLCARPAAEFVCAAKGFRSQIWLVKGGERFSANGIIDVLSASLNCEETATIEADGPDAEEAVERLAALIREFGKRDRDGTSSSFRRCEDDF